MQERQVVSGFSDLKNLLIRTYSIEREALDVRLWFTEEDGYLRMHDYDDHKKALTIFDKKSKNLAKEISVRSAKLIEYALEHDNPEQFLNEQFQLCGFFRFRIRGK